MKKSFLTVILLGVLFTLTPSLNTFASAYGWEQSEDPRKEELHEEYDSVVVENFGECFRPLKESLGSYEEAIEQAPITCPIDHEGNSEAHEAISEDEESEEPWVEWGVMFSTSSR